MSPKTVQGPVCVVFCVCEINIKERRSRTLFMDGGQVRGYSSAAVCSRLFKLRMFVMIQPGLTVISQKQQKKLPEPQKREIKMADCESPLFKSINT